MSRPVPNSPRLGRVSVTALLALATLASPVQATTFAALSLTQQAKKADVIVQATIGAPTTVTEAGRTYNVYPLKVSETLAGDAAMLPQIGDTQGGGSPALYVLSGMERGPSFQSGQEAVLLLYKGRFDSPLVGFNQGAYLVSGGLVSVLFAPEPNPATQTAVNQNAVNQDPVPQEAVVQNAPTVAAVTTPPTAGTTGTTGQNETVQTPVTPVAQPSVALLPVVQLPAVQTLPSPGASVSAVTVGVLGKIRTPAELKAAIVAARAAK